MNGQNRKIGHAMNYGLQISASGALASIHQQDALTNNLANINTTGFKPILTGTMFRDAVRQEDGLGHMNSSSLMERLGGGVLAAQTRIDFAQGTLEATDNDTDLAIQGDGFFVVGDPSNPTLTRDGRFTINNQGTLVMVTNGSPLLSTGNKPIEVDPSLGDLSISSDGTVSQAGETIATIQIANVPDLSNLTKLGSGLFGSKFGNNLDLIDATGIIRQGMLEAARRII